MRQLVRNIHHEESVKGKMQFTIISEEILKALNVDALIEEACNVSNKERLVCEFRKKNRKPSAEDLPETEETGKIIV